MPEPQLHAVVTGKVQGVYFRAWTRDAALSLGLTGWVRNLPDGNVETVALGPAEVLERFRAMLRQGPPLARVGQVLELPPLPAETEPPLTGFEIRR
ncbi:MAG: acylphosphatase [Desulfovibrionaceae bacterium]